MAKKKLSADERKIKTQLAKMFVDQNLVGIMGGKWSRLTEARKNLGYTQDELAEAVGMSPVTLSRWETSGKLPDSANTYLLISRMLNVPLDWLLYNDDLVGAVSDEEAEVLEKASEILKRVYGKKDGRLIP